MGYDLNFYKVNKSQLDAENKFSSIDDINMDNIASESTNICFNILEEMKEKNMLPYFNNVNTILSERNIKNIIEYLNNYETDNDLEKQSVNNVKNALNTWFKNLKDYYIIISED